MALDFPNDQSPQVGTVYTGTNGVTYTYDGTKWIGATGTGIDLSAVAQNIVPASDVTYNLGSLSKQWKSLYVGTSTIYIDGTPVSVSKDGRLLVDGKTPTANIDFVDTSIRALHNTVSNDVKILPVPAYPVGSSKYWINLYGTETPTGTVVTGNGIAYDSLGNVIIATTTLRSGSYYNAVVVKYGPNGNILWDKHIQGLTETCSAEAVAVGPDDTIHVLIKDQSYDQATVVKLDVDGNILWQTAVTGDTSLAFDIEVDVNGNVYFVVWGTDYTIQKFDSSGNDSGDALVIDNPIILTSTDLYIDKQDGSIYCGSRTVDPNTSSYAGLLLKFPADYDPNTAGNTYLTSVFIPEFLAVFAVTSDSQSNVYVASSDVTGGKNDIIKLVPVTSSTYEIAWSKHISNISIMSMMTDSNDDLYVNGRTTLNTATIAVLKFSSAGDVQWKKSIGDPYAEVNEWFWLGHQTIVIHDDVYSMTGYVASASTSSLAVTVQLPTDQELVTDSASLPADQYGIFRYYNNPDLVVTDITYTATDYSSYIQSIPNLAHRDPASTIGITSTSLVSTSTNILGFMGTRDQLLQRAEFAFKPDGSIEMPNGTVIGGTFEAGNVTIQTTNYLGSPTQALVWDFSNTGTFSTPGSVVPDADNVHDLGTPNKQWRHLYVSTGSIYLGNIKLSNDNGIFKAETITYVLDTSTNETVAVIDTSIDLNRTVNINIDGGAASVIYEVVDLAYADGGGSSTRYGVNTVAYNGGTSVATTITNTLNGGGA